MDYVHLMQEPQNNQRLKSKSEMWRIQTLRMAHPLGWPLAARYTIEASTRNMATTCGVPLHSY